MEIVRHQIFNNIHVHDTETNDLKFVDNVTVLERNTFDELLILILILRLRLSTDRLQSILNKPLLYGEWTKRDGYKMTGVVTPLKLSELLLLLLLLLLLMLLCCPCQRVTSFVFLIVHQLKQNTVCIVFLRSIVAVTVVLSRCSHDIIRRHHRHHHYRATIRLIICLEFHQLRIILLVRV